MAAYEFDIEALREGAMPTRKQMAITVLLLSVPAILAELSTTLMQYIDASMVGSLGAHATAAIGVVESSIWLLDGLAMSAAAGFTVQVAQLVGAGRNADARNVFRQAIVVLLAFACVLAGIGVLISHDLPTWLGGDPSLQEDATAYFFICSISLVPITMARLGTGMLQCSGDMRTPSMLNVLACMLDVSFNAVLIHEGPLLQLGPAALPIPGMGLGIRGAALGTLLAQTVTASLLLAFACTRSERLRFQEHGSWLPTASTLRPAWRVSWPMILERTLLSTAYIAVTAIVAPLGIVAVAANSLGITVEAVCYMPGFGIASAATTLVGQAFGAQRLDVARSFARLSTALGIAIMTISGALMFVFAPQILGMLTPDTGVRELGTTVLRIEAFAEPLFAASIVAAGALRGAGDTLVPSLFTLLCNWGVRIPAMALVAPYFGLVGCWAVMAFELCVRGTLFLVRLLRGTWLFRASTST
jgi:putative MATE family efflux protein